HNRWAKNIPTMWNEIARTPFFIWDPRSPSAAGQRRSALVQPAIDLGPTLLEFFGLAPTADMTGLDLAPAIRDDSAIRQDAIFGYFGLPVHYTDGRYVYMRRVVDPEQEHHIYSSLPVHFRGRWTEEDWKGAELVSPLPFSKNMPVIRRPAPNHNVSSLPSHLLFDLEKDPGQESPVDQKEIESRITERMTMLMKEAHSPEEILKRYGLG
ncbi:MAG: sulfatase, partial [Puniceicoccales bacterium]